MPEMSPQRLKILKAVVFIASLVPFVRLIFGAFTNDLGANPVEYITRNTGDQALHFLCITLAVTPLRRLTKWNWLIKLRRMFGLFMFFYACLHFMAFFWFDHFFDVAAMLKDVKKRPFITVGFTAFLLLIPLAATSTNAMVRRLGGKRWQALHRLVYVIALLAILHYWWMKAGKHDFAMPILWGSIVAALLLMRMPKLIGWMRARAGGLKASPR